MRAQTEMSAAPVQSDSHSQQSSTGRHQHDPLQDAALSRGLSHHGFRFTPQRREVYDALLETRDHPTATEVFMRVKNRLPSISLATVYNCLETLTASGLVRLVNIERGPSRYCPNLETHGHFCCSECGTVIDVSLPPAAEVVKGWDLPEGVHVTDIDVTLRGKCPSCSGKLQLH